MSTNLDEIRAEAEGKPLAMRSCWNCNPSHQHLKKETECVIYCFECGNYFFKGVKITDQEE
jgi:uncharacterized Zn finger protein